MNAFVIVKIPSVTFTVICFVYFISNRIVYGNGCCKALDTTKKEFNKLDLGSLLGWEHVSTASYIVFWKFDMMYYHGVSLFHIFSGWVIAI